MLTQRQSEQVRDILEQINIHIKGLKLGELQAVALYRPAQKDTPEALMLRVSDGKIKRLLVLSLDLWKPAIVEAMIQGLTAAYIKDNFERPIPNRKLVFSLPAEIPLSNEQLNMFLDWVRGKGPCPDFVDQTKL